MLNELHPLWLYAAQMQITEQLRQPAGVVDQRKAPSVFQNARRSPAELFQCTALLAPGRSAGFARPHRKPGGIGKDQVKAPGRKQVRIAQVSRQDPPCDPVESVVFFCQRRSRRIALHPCKGQLCFPLQQQQPRRAGAARQIAYFPSLAHCCESSQGQRLAPQFEAAVPLYQAEAAQNLCLFRGPCPLSRYTKVGPRAILVWKICLGRGQLWK